MPNLGKIQKKIYVRFATCVLREFLGALPLREEHIEGERHTGI
jgi:hypothetical protein